MRSIKGPNVCVVAIISKLKPKKNKKKSERNDDDGISSSFYIVWAIYIVSGSLCCDLTRKQSQSLAQKPHVFYCAARQNTIVWYVQEATRQKEYSRKFVTYPLRWNRSRTLSTIKLAVDYFIISIRYFSYVHVVRVHVIRIRLSDILRRAL